MSDELFLFTLGAPVVITLMALVTAEDGSLRSRSAALNIGLGWIFFGIHWIIPLIISVFILTLPATIKGDAKAAKKIKESKTFNITDVI